MKLFGCFALGFWLLCGIAAAWILEGRDDLHWKTIAKGPISLVKAINEHPITYQD
jgi:hypothetical protein